MGADRRGHWARLDDDDMPTMDLHTDSRSIDDDDAFEPGDDDGVPPTTRDADHHTIVDMNLRVVRFVIVVAVALVVAFAYATFTNQPYTLAHAATATDAEDSVAFYNVIFGPTMFATSKIFEIYTETLIFPTLHTYLHNCSLYPGDEPQRTTSRIKTRAIFWGLKTVVILMNVGTASLFVSSRTPRTTSTSAVAHSVETHARRLQQDISTAQNLDGFAAFLQGGGASPFVEDTAALCGATSKWTRADVDYTSVAFGFARRPWSEQVVDTTAQSHNNAAVVVLGLKDCVEGVATACEDTLWSHGFQPREVARVLAHGVAVQETNTTMRAATSALSAAIQTRDATLSVERTHSSVGMTSLSAVVTFERILPDEAVSCGVRSCVASVSASPSQGMWIQQLDSGYEFLTSSTSRRAVSGSDGSVREARSLSFASHTLSSPELRVQIGEDGTQVVVSDLSSLAQRPTRLVSLHDVVLPDTIELKTWLPVENAKASSQSQCDPLVDAYVTQFQKTTALFSPSRLASTIATATLLFLTQSATYVPSETAMLARRLEETAGSTETVKLELSITMYSAAATFAGCGIMVLLMVFVILRPQARVRLTPNTTAAAQYVQILTDDLYPNIVHKKRLRFVNGEALPFNEYVVDSIVLHAKRDESKKIYL